MSSPFDPVLFGVELVEHADLDVDGDAPDSRELGAQPLVQQEFPETFNQTVRVKRHGFVIKGVPDLVSELELVDSALRVVEPKELWSIRGNMCMVEILICGVQFRSLLLQIIPDFVSVLHFVEPFFAARLLAEREHLCSMSLHGKSKLSCTLVRNLDF